MFQVKFVRRPLAVQDSHKWLLDVIKSEAPKVKKQVRKGAKFFVLMTNALGTAHGEVGSIDRANKFLSEELGIPSQCLWRNDLARRLDTSWDLKWTYPELMTGPDLIRLVIEESLTEHKERRANAIRAFVSAQYAADQYVKFKQVDLENKLLDLFIDVPIRDQYEGRFYRVSTYVRSLDFASEGWVYPQRLDEEQAYLVYPHEVSRRVRKQETGMAEFLLGGSSLRHLSRVVIEGAPGQGKSTIAQFICQAHRMRLLDKRDDLKLVKQEYLESPIRLPIKVDLRDFATWLGKRNPFSVEPDDEVPEQWERSLESFLAALIRTQSGGAAFDVSDLHAVSKLSSVLLVLDGLDEVADIKRRTDVVAEIEKGADRLQTVAAGLQVVVTSRPAAFENSPGLPEDSFRYLSLGSVTQPLIDEYAAKWLIARRVDDRGSAEVKRILREKLAQPHLRDLARNPMQLAILLSLIHTRGVSLPDKRTALYDSYVELFFNRESEKSETVRENRDLLIDIHRFLAWLLHTESEQGGTMHRRSQSGAIEAARLRSVVREYLQNEGQDPELTEVLFTGMVERVVALVSRVQGTFEFEVQPLREYFAARFLHETAPYSPVGNEQSGTRPDRFDAIARNFYWLNVTRFYAGCYSKGELPSLIDRLRELIEDPDFRYLSHPRVLGATLLGDWVFSQHPKSVTEVVKLILDGLGLRFLLASTSRRHSHGQPLILPLACGRQELVSRCFAILNSFPPMDYALDVIDLITSNKATDDISVAWKTEALSRSHDERTAWIEYGVHLGCLPLATDSELDALLSDETVGPRRIDALFRAHRARYIERNAEKAKVALHSVLNTAVKVSHLSRHPSALELFAYAVNPRLYVLGFREASHVPLADVVRRFSPSGNATPYAESVQEVDWECIPAGREVADASVKGLSLESARWSAELQPWDDVVTAITGSFGENWSARLLAIVAGSIRSPSEQCTDSPKLFDRNSSLCRRARYARLRAGTVSWWSSQLDEAESVEDQLFGCLALVVWGSLNVLSQTLLQLDKMVEAFAPSQWALLIGLVEDALEFTQLNGKTRYVEPFLAPKQLKDLSPRTLVLLRLRGKTGSCTYYKTWLATRDKLDGRSIAVFQDDALAALYDDSESAKPHLQVISDGYRAGRLSAPFASAEYARRSLPRQLSPTLARAIVEMADQLPGFLVAAAELSCRQDTASRIKPVGDIARSDRWFRNE